jgi:hypothetical protein
MNSQSISAGKNKLTVRKASVRTCSQCKCTGHDKRTCKKSVEYLPAGFSTPQRQYPQSRKTAKARTRKPTGFSMGSTNPFASLNSISPIKGDAPAGEFGDSVFKTPLPVRPLKRNRSTKTVKARPTVIGSNNSNKSPDTKRSVLPDPTPIKSVQGHGITWEKDILLSVFGVPRVILDARKANAKFDLEGKYNTLDPSVNLSIKAAGSNTVNMGDCQRVFDVVSSNTPFHIIVIKYKQYLNPDIKRVKRITEMDLTGAKKLLFGDLTKEQIKHLDMSIKENVPKCTYPSATNKANLGSIKKSISGSLRATRLDIKCSTNQRRLQFSIRNWQKFINDNPELVISDSSDNEFRGGAIRHKLYSSPRSSKKEEEQEPLDEIPQMLLINSDIHLPDESMIGI